VVATVVSASLPIAAQLLPGDEVIFAEVSVERALQMRKSLENALSSIGRQ
jgi:allophanate hydrolase subunit 2